MMIGLVCALRCEAESLIRHFELRVFPQKSLYPIYGNDSILLIVSGIGKMQAAAAVSYLYALMGQPSFTAWINVGVAGHSTYPVGEGFYGHQVIDQGSLRKFYPTLTWKDSIASETILTVDSVEKEFTQTGIYEMEAAGFCSSAFSLTTSELIHCYKVISDNQKTPPLKDTYFVQELIQKHVRLIETLVNRLHQTLSELNEWTSVSETLRPFLERWHFTQTEFYQLQRLLQRWEALLPTEPICLESLFHCKKGKEVLRILDQKLKIACFL